MPKIPIREATFVWSDNPYSFCVCRQGEGPDCDYSDGCVWSAWRAAPEAELWIALLVLIDRCVTLYKLDRESIEAHLVQGLQGYAHIGDRLDRWQLSEPKKTALKTRNTRKTCPDEIADTERKAESPGAESEERAA